MQEPTRLTSRDRMLLCASAIALAAVTAMLQCAALSIGTDARAMLTTAAGLIAALAVSVLIEDALVVPLRAALRCFPTWTSRQRVA